MPPVYAGSAGKSMVSGTVLPFGAENLLIGFLRKKELLFGYKMLLYGAYKTKNVCL